MKKVLIIMLLLPTFIWAQTSTLEFKNSEIALNTVMAYVNALQKGDVETMNAQLTKDALIYNLGGAGDSINVTQHGDYYKNSVSNFTHEFSRDLYLPVKVTNSWNEGEWVLCWGTNTITSKQSGQKIAVPFHTAAMVENGKVKALYYFYDMLNILKNQGYKIEPPSK